MRAEARRFLIDFLGFIECLEFLGFQELFCQLAIEANWSPRPRRSPKQRLSLRAIAASLWICARFGSITICSNSVPVDPDVPLQLCADSCGERASGYCAGRSAQSQSDRRAFGAAAEKLKVKVATLSQISDLLKKTEQSQRVLEEVTEGFTLDVMSVMRRIRKRPSPSTSSPPTALLRR